MANFIPTVICTHRKDVRKELEKINNMDEKASMKINKILSDSNLPLKIAKATKKEVGY